MKLNCDLGESFGSWTMGRDDQVMPHIDQANIACGFHAGDPLILQKTLSLAKTHHVSVGAHPSYPDRQGFGRRSMTMSATELRENLHYQIAAIAGMASVQGLSVDYVKPHGALYNDMMRHADIRATVMQAIADYPLPLALMIQATPDYPSHQQEAESYGVSLIFEAFADRAYQADGRLVPRGEPGAVLNSGQIMARIDELTANRTIKAQNGEPLTFPIDSLCVHGDNDESTSMIQKIRSRLYETQR